MKNLLLSASAVAMIITASQANSPEAHHDAKVAHEKHWDYGQNGPAHWGEFSKTCAVGQAQSPVNITIDKTVKLNPEYKLTLQEDVQTTAKVIDNGHSIKVTPKESGTITLNGETFKLLQLQKTHQIGHPSRRHPATPVA